MKPASAPLPLFNNKMLLIRTAGLLEVMAQCAEPMLRDALAIARDSDGLVREDKEAAWIVYMHIVHAIMSAESQEVKVEYRRKARERATNLFSHIGRLEALQSELEKEREGLDPFLAIERRASASYAQTIDDLAAVIASLNELAKARKEFGSLGAGNRHHFDSAFVHAIRMCWRDITGQEPGISRAPVIYFAISVSDAFHLFDNTERPLFDRLAERFDKVR